MGVVRPEEEVPPVAFPGIQTGGRDRGSSPEAGPQPGEAEREIHERTPGTVFENVGGSGQRARIRYPSNSVKTGSKEKQPTEKILSDGCGMGRALALGNRFGRFAPLATRESDLRLGVEYAGHGGGFETGWFSRVDPFGAGVRLGERDDASALALVAGALHADGRAERE